MHIVKQDQLPFSRIAHELVGDDHGGIGVCILFVDAPPGDGPSLHRHPYEEIFIVEEGEALFVADGAERTAVAGEIVVLPADTPHRFTNTGSGPLRQIDIHVSPRFVTEWLDEAAQPARGRSA